MILPCLLKVPGTGADSPEGLPATPTVHEASIRRRRRRAIADSCNFLPDKSMFRLQRTAFQTIRPVVSRKNAGFPRPSNRDCRRAKNREPPAATQREAPEPHHPRPARAGFHQKKIRTCGPTTLLFRQLSGITIKTLSPASQGNIQDKMKRKHYISTYYNINHTVFPR